MNRHTRTFRRRGGFSLVELLLVLALLGLLSAVLVPAAGGLLPRPGAGAWEDNVAETFQQVRREAVSGGREILVQFDAEAGRFTWAGGRGAPLGAPRLTVDFLRAAGGGSVLLGGQLVETAGRPGLRFFPDGTCEPVRLQLRAPGEPVRVVGIDPWTCAPGLEDKR